MRLHDGIRDGLSLARGFSLLAAADEGTSPDTTSPAKGARSEQAGLLVATPGGRRATSRSRIGVKICVYLRRTGALYRESEIQKLIEQTLLGEALMAAPIAASVFDDDRHYIAVNDAFCRLTLYERDELTAITAGVQLAPDDEAREAIRTAIREHGAAGENNVRRKDGSVIRAAYWVLETKVALGVYYLRFSWAIERTPWTLVAAHA